MVYGPLHYGCVFRLEAQMDLAGGRAKFKPMLGIYMWGYLK